VLRDDRILDLFPVVLDPAAAQELFSEREILAQNFEYFGLRRQPTTFLVRSELLAGFLRRYFWVVLLQGVVYVLVLQSESLLDLRVD